MSDYTFYNHGNKYSFESMQKGKKVTVSSSVYDSWKDHFMRATGAEKFNKKDFHDYLYRTRSLTPGLELPTRLMNEKQRIIYDENITNRGLY